MSDLDELRRIASHDQASAAMRDFAASAETILSALAGTARFMAVAMQNFPQSVVDFRTYMVRDPRARAMLMTRAQFQHQYQRQQIRRRRRVRQRR